MQTTSYEQHRHRIHQLAELFGSIIKLETECLYRSGMIDPAAYSRESGDLATILIRAAIERTKDSGPLRLYTDKQQAEARNLEHA